MIVRVYADGGQLSRNDKGTGSVYGGMYAYCLVNEEDERIAYQSGLVFPGPCKEAHNHLEYACLTGLSKFILCRNNIYMNNLYGVTNNHSEAIAAWRALQILPDGWSGTICLDSEVTLLRLTGEYKRWNNVPEALRFHIQQELNRLGKWKPELVAGHPVPAELAVGYRVKHNKRGSPRYVPVSRHNEFCDSLCNSVKEEYLHSIGKEWRAAPCRY